MQLNYIYRKYDDFYVGHLVDFPDYETQGKTKDELELMLKSLYSDLMAYDDITVAAMLEAERMESDPTVRRYTDVEEALRELKS